MKLPRIYCDSSVIGGYFDPEFERESRRFIDAVKNGRIVMLLSEVVIQEILLAPENVQNVLASIPTSSIERVPLSTEIIELGMRILRQEFSVRNGSMMQLMLQRPQLRGLMPLCRGTFRTSYVWTR